MNVIEYIKKYGDTSFKKLPLNDADKLLFGLLSYVTYDGLVSKNENNKRKLCEVAEEYMKTHSRSENRKNLLAVRGAIKLLNLIRKKKRYEDILVYNDCYIGDDSQQFSAICIEINPKLVYVSFEGTDHLISGWKEDAQMSYKFPVKAQRHAYQYLNKHFLFKHCDIIVGGHSKGGNLALVSAMYCFPFIRKRIKEIYSYDGPGLIKSQIESKRYAEVESRFNLIVPQNSFVGMLFRHTKYTVIKTSGVGLIGHYAERWQFEDTEFKKVKLSNTSKILDNGVRTWLDKYNYHERKMFFDEIFDLFKNQNVTSLLDFVDEPKLLINMYKDADNLDPRVGEMLKDLIDIVVDYSKKSIISFFKR